MNVLFLTTHFNTGGITSYVLTLGEALVNSGHRVWVASSGGDCVPCLEVLGIKHFQVNIRTKFELHPKLCQSYGPLRRLVQVERISIIHAQTRVSQVLGYFLGRFTGLNMVTTCHGFFKPKWFRRVFPCWGSAVIAISKPVAEHLSKDFKLPAKQIHLIANGIDLDKFAPATDQTRREARKRLGLNEAPLIGIIARLSDVKGIDVLIRSMPYLIREIPAVNLLIAGQGPQEDVLKKLTLDLSLSGHVHFRDISNAPQDLLPAFDVFAMPSLMEGLGLSVIEAQASGIPVVATRVGGLVDLIENAKSGYLVPVNDPEALASSILQMLRNPQKARAMAQAARLNAVKSFSSKRMLQETLRVYEQYSCR